MFLGRWAADVDTCMILVCLNTKLPQVEGTLGHEADYIVPIQPVFWG